MDIELTLRFYVKKNKKEFMQPLFNNPDYHLIVLLLTLCAGTAEKEATRTVMAMTKITVFIILSNQICYFHTNWYTMVPGIPGQVRLTKFYTGEAKKTNFNWNRILAYYIFSTWS